MDLTGWYLVSVTGNQKYTFPDGYRLKAGAEITIASNEETGDLFWTKANVWNNSASDPAELYDSNGNPE